MHWLRRCGGFGKEMSSGNVFSAGETIHFATASGRAYRVLDHTGALIQCGRESHLTSIELDGLEPGYYEFFDGQHPTAFVVLRQPAGFKDEHCRIGVDCATAWLAPQQVPILAAMLRKTDIRWVRERVSWGEVQLSRDSFDWRGYGDTIDIFAKAGLRVLQVLQDSPMWTHPKDFEQLSPDDLRVVYRFAKAAARRFTAGVHAWEVWNEADSEFWPNLSDRFAGFQKAAYLGFKRSGPGVDVLLSSMCKGASPFAANLLACRPYFDVFSFHTYVGPEYYSERIKTYRRTMTSGGVGDRPVWITEAGIRLLDGGAALSRQDQMLQAEFIPKSVAMALAGGIDRYFYFVLVNYLEAGYQYGCLRSDLTPYPSFAALATCANLLGESVYLGRCRTRNRGVQIHLFETPGGWLGVAWAERPTIQEIHADGTVLDLINLVGGTKRVRADGGLLEVQLSTSPQFLVPLRKTMPVCQDNYEEKNRMQPRALTNDVIFRGYAIGARIDRKSDCYIVGSSSTIEFRIEVCNLNEEEPASVQIKIELPDGWRMSQRSFRRRLPPMGREVIAIPLRTANVSSSIAELKVTGKAGARMLAPSISRFSISVP
jgi:hypothetical protein